MEALEVKFLTLHRHELIHFLQCAKSESVRTDSVELDRFGVDAQRLCHIPIGVEVETFQAELQLLQVTSRNDSHSLPLLNHLNGNLFGARWLIF